MQTIEITVPGVPVGKQRPRVTATHTYTPQKTKDYERHIRECWLEQSNKRFKDNTELSLMVKAFFPIPKSLSKKKKMELDGSGYTHKCDIDNLIKSVADALNGYAYDDDSRIVMVLATKRYSFEPRVDISIRGAEFAEEDETGKQPMQ